MGLEAQPLRDLGKGPLLHPEVQDLPVRFRKPLYELPDFTGYNPQSTGAAAPFLIIQHPCSAAAFFKYDPGCAIKKFFQKLA